MKKIKAIEYIERVLNYIKEVKNCNDIDKLKEYLEAIELSCSIAKEHLESLEKRINELI